MGTRNGLRDVVELAGRQRWGRAEMRRMVVLWVSALALGACGEDPVEVTAGTVEVVTVTMDCSLTRAMNCWLTGCSCRTSRPTERWHSKSRRESTPSSSRTSRRPVWSTERIRSRSPSRRARLQLSRSLSSARYFARPAAVFGMTTFGQGAPPRAQAAGRAKSVTLPAARLLGPLEHNLYYRLRAQADAHQRRAGQSPLIPAFVSARTISERQVGRSSLPRPTSSESTPHLALGSWARVGLPQMRRARPFFAKHLTTELIKRKNFRKRGEPTPAAESNALQSKPRRRVPVAGKQRQRASQSIEAVSMSTSVSVKRVGDDDYDGATGERFSRELADPVGRQERGPFARALNPVRLPRNLSTTMGHSSGLIREQSPVWWGSGWAG